MAGIIVTMRGFRSHARSRYTFEKHKSTYVCGPNGAGKSDIYYAVRWCLFPKKGEAVHPLGTNTTVYVSLEIDSDAVGKVTITRTVLDKDNSIVVARGEKITRGDDAETLIIAMFGTRRLFDMQCNFSEFVNPFVSLPAPQKMEVMNEMSGNLGDAKQRITALISLAKSEMEAAKIKHIKIKAGFDAVFLDSALDAAAILSPDDLAKREEELHALRTEIVTCNDQLSRRRVHAQKRREVSLQLSNIGDVTSEALEELERDHLSSTIYQQMIENVASLLKPLQEHFTPEEIRQQCYTSEDIITAQAVERHRENFSAIVRKHNLVCTQEAATERVEEIDNLISSSSLSAIVQEYRQARVQARRAQTALSTHSPELARHSLEDLLALQRQLDNSLQHAVLWHEHLKLEELRRQKGERGKEALEESLRVNQLNLSSLPLFQQRTSYENFSHRCFSRLVLPEGVSRRCTQLQELLRDIEQSKSVHNCPHCSGATKFVSGRLVKHEGQIVQGDEVATAQEVGMLRTLSNMPYPTIPKDVVYLKEEDLRSNIFRDTSQLQLLERLTALEGTIKPLPTGYAYVPDAVSKLADLRKAIDLRKECDRYAAALSALPVPVIPEGFVTRVVDVARLQDERRNLVSIVFPTLEKSSAAIRAHIAHRTAKDQLGKLLKPQRVVSSQDVCAYREHLMKRTHLEQDLQAITRQLSAITYTLEQQREMEARITTLIEQIKSSKHQTAMQKAAKDLSVAEDALRVAQEEVSDVLEFKALYDSKSKECVPSVAGRIQRRVNAFLEEIESPVRVSLVISDKIKIQCFKGGLMFGDVTNLCKGERSCVYFAFNVAFALESPLDILIMDEVTDKLSPENKNKCLGLLLAITSFPPNVPREQIEQMDNISRAMKTLVSGHNRKTLMFTDHHHHQGGCDKTIDLTYKAQMQ